MKFTFTVVKEKTIFERLEYTIEADCRHEAQMKVISDGLHSLKPVVTEEGGSVEYTSGDGNVFGNGKNVLSDSVARRFFRKATKTDIRRIKSYLLRIKGWEK